MPKIPLCRKPFISFEVLFFSFPATVSFCLLKIKWHRLETVLRKMQFGAYKEALEGQLFKSNAFTSCVFEKSNPEGKQ